VLSQPVPGDDPHHHVMRMEDVRNNFSGETVVGRDLMMI
jgi:hypothetical protein